jgi:hypothetical protein
MHTYIFFIAFLDDQFTWNDKNILLKYIYLCLQFERSGMVLMSHIREASKVTVNSSHFHPAHQHYTDEAHKAETVPSVVIYMYIYLSAYAGYGNYEIYTQCHKHTRLY